MSQPLLTNSSSSEIAGAKDEQGVYESQLSLLHDVSRGQCPVFGSAHLQVCRLALRCLNLLYVHADG